MLAGNGSMTTCVAYISFAAGNIDDHVSSTVVTYQANQWHHLEMRNISWQHEFYNLYVDDVLVHGGVTFYGANATSIGTLYLSNTTGAIVYFDQIEFD